MASSYGNLPYSSESSSSSSVIRKRISKGPELKTLGGSGRLAGRKAVYLGQGLELGLYQSIGDESPKDESPKEARDLMPSNEPAKGTSLATALAQVDYLNKELSADKIEGTEALSPEDYLSEVFGEYKTEETTKRTKKTELNTWYVEKVAEEKAVYCLVFKVEHLYSVFLNPKFTESSEVFAGLKKKLGEDLIKDAEGRYRLSTGYLVDVLDLVRQNNQKPVKNLEDPFLSPRGFS